MSDVERIEAAIRDAMIAESPALRAACVNVRDRFIATPEWHEIPGFYDHQFATAYAQIIAPRVAEILEKGDVQ